MGDRFLVKTEGDTHRYLGRQFEGGKLVHYRGHTADFQPTIERTKMMAEANAPSSEHQYLGTVRREVIHDWLMKQQKTWHDFATDEDLKAKFMVYYKNEFSKMMASSYQERKLSINRTVAAPKGNSILSQYRKEQSGDASYR